MSDRTGPRVRAWYSMIDDGSVEVELEVGVRRSALLDGGAGIELYNVSGEVYLTLTPGNALKLAKLLAEAAEGGQE